MCGEDREKGENADILYINNFIQNRNLARAQPWYD
jgi:hypothetical protein